MTRRLRTTGTLLLLLSSGCDGGKAAPGSGPAGGDDTTQDRALAEKHYRAAMQHLDANKSILAIGELDKAIAATPEDARFHRELGNTLLLPSPDRDPEEARACFERALKLGDLTVTVPLARAETLLGHWTAAQQLLQEYLSGTRSLAEASTGEAQLLLAQVHVHEANIEGVQELLAQAEECLQARVKLGPSRREHRRLIGLISECDSTAIEALLVQGNAVRAVERSRLLVEQQPETSSRRELFARSLEAAGETEESQIQHRASELLRRLATVVNQPSVPIDTVESLIEELGAISPISPRLPLQLVRACLSRKLRERAADLCRQFRDGVSNPESIKGLIGEAWFLEGRSLKELSANSPRSHPKMREWLERALKCYEEAANLEAGFAGEYRRLRGVIEARLQALSAGSCPVP